MISGILAGGIPGFRIEPLLLPTPSELAQCVLWWVLFCFGFLWACVNMAHKMSFCMYGDDTKLSPLALIDLFSPINWNCHVTALCFVLFFAWFVCACFVWCFVWFSGLT